jgi:hypothetical protein
MDALAGIWPPVYNPIMNRVKAPGGHSPVSEILGQRHKFPESLVYALLKH